jgi:uncharacterized protein (DUF1501 family)
MLKILGSTKRLCDGLSRRDLLHAGASSLLGLSLADLTRKPANANVARARNFGAAKNVILLYLYGAVSQIDTLDPKPNAPSNIRGPFRAINTKIPGVHLGEHLPRLAERMDKITVVRSMNHPLPIHNVANTVTGIRETDIPMETNGRDPRHWPFFGSVLDYLDGQSPGRLNGAMIPKNVIIPWRQSAQIPGRRGGFYGGFLGSRYDPTPLEYQGRGTIADCVEPNNPYCGIHLADSFNFPSTSFAPEITLDRFRDRRSLLTQLTEQQRQLTAGSARAYDSLQQVALGLCDSGSLPAALDLRRETAATRERYGRHLFGQSSLLARRLIEAGSRVVTVLWDEWVTINSAWDTHNVATRRLSRELCPGFDQAFAALYDDLEQRGLLDETLVLCLTEHGRTPLPENDGDGRNHWSGVYSIFMCGAGVARGNVVGSSDRQGGAPHTRPVNPKDILQTVYHLLGVDTERSIPDRQDRPMPLVEGGQVVPEILA